MGRDFDWCEYPYGSRIKPEEPNFDKEPEYFEEFVWEGCLCLLKMKP